MKAGEGKEKRKGRGRRGSGRTKWKKRYWGREKVEAGGEEE